MLFIVSQEDCFRLLIINAFLCKTKCLVYKYQPNLLFVQSAKQCCLILREKKTTSLISQLQNKFDFRSFTFMKQTICSDLLLWISISPSFADGDKCCILMNVKLFWICKYAVKVSLTYGLVHMGQQDAGFAWIVLCRAFHCNLTGHQIDTESSTFLNGKLSLSLCIINTHLGVMLAVCVKLC